LQLSMNIKKIIAIILFVVAILMILYYAYYSLFVNILFVALISMPIVGYLIALKLNNKYIYFALGVGLLLLFKVYGLILFIILMLLPTVKYLSSKHKNYSDFWYINNDT
jgi:hypothetical protein